MSETIVPENVAEAAASSITAESGRDARKSNSFAWQKPRTDAVKPAANEGEIYFNFISHFLQKLKVEK
jgi:hypothetical protein